MKPKTKQKPKEQTEHKTISVSTSYEVDENILPVVNWLNSIRDVRTEYSCEGDKGLKEGWQSYVLFSCDSMLGLNTIVFLTQKEISSQRIKIDIIQPNSYIPRVRFTIRFLNKEVLKIFIDTVLNNGKINYEKNIRNLK